MSWRHIHVDGDDYQWTISGSPATRAAGELATFRITVVIRAVEARTRVTATFHGFCVEDLWDGRRQNLMVTPRVVAEIIRRSTTHGPVLDHAERVFPDAVTAADPADTALAAACAQWFVPYPGRAALEQALRETNGDHVLAAARLSTATYTLTAAQLEAWAKQLGIVE